MIINMFIVGFSVIRCIPPSPVGWNDFICAVIFLHKQKGINGGNILLTEITKAPEINTNFNTKCSCISGGNLTKAVDMSDNAKLTKHFEH